jgi:hypothetical protein
VTARVKVIEPTEVLPPVRNAGQMRKGETRNPGGRRKGEPNKITRIIKEATLIAAELTGKPTPIFKKDKKGKLTQEIIGWEFNGTGGLIGYMRHVAETDTKSFCGLLGRILPSQITTGDEDGDSEYETVQDVEQRLKDKGLSAKLVENLVAQVFDKRIKPMKEK